MKLAISLVLVAALGAGCKRKTEPELPPDMPENAALKRARLAKEMQAVGEPEPPPPDPTFGLPTSTIAPAPPPMPARPGSFFDPPAAGTAEPALAVPQEALDKMRPENYAPGEYPGSGPARREK